MNPIERELKVLRGFATCAGDDVRIDEAEKELARLRAAIVHLALGLDLVRRRPAGESAFIAYHCLNDAETKFGVSVSP